MKISQTRLLQIKYKHSLKMLKKDFESVHSYSLDELYTPAYRPLENNKGLTTIKDKKSNKLVDVFVRAKETSSRKRKVRQYSIYKNKYSFALGKKDFVFDLKKDGSGEYYFNPGFIKSRKNNKYAGTQIRLLQVACELAKKYNIQSIPLISLKAPIQFHTMMGFRPDASYTFFVKTLEDYQCAIRDKLADCFPELFNGEKKVVLSKDDHGFYYVDLNRSMYCSLMQRVRELQQKTHKKIISNGLFDISMVNMTLSGKELNKWFERLKGFEILPPDELIKHE